MRRRERRERGERLSSGHDETAGTARQRARRDSGHDDTACTTRRDEETTAAVDPSIGRATRTSHSRNVGSAMPTEADSAVMSGVRERRGKKAGARRSPRSLCLPHAYTVQLVKLKE